MRAAQLALAFLAGALLYYVTVIYVGGTFAAVTIPRSYFEFFGKQNVSFALALLSLVTWALPVGILVTASYLPGRHLLPGLRNAVSYSITVGMLACAAYWLWRGEFGFASLSLAPWWSVPNGVAPWVGAALGVWLVRRSKVAVPHAGA